MIIRNGRKIGHGGLDLGPADYAEKPKAVPHDWVPSTLGHGETMCLRCYMTNREAAALHMLDECGMIFRPLRDYVPNDAKTFAEDDQPAPEPDTGIPEVKGGLMKYHPPED